jgi:hypothetical protein
MEIKPELKDGLKRAIGSTFKIHFGCVKDKDGVPIPFHLTHCELKDEFIIFEAIAQKIPPKQTYKLLVYC